MLCGLGHKVSLQPRNLRVAGVAASVNVAPPNGEVCLNLEEARQYLPDVRSCIPRLEQTLERESCRAVTARGFSPGRTDAAICKSSSQTKGTSSWTQEGRNTRRDAWASLLKLQPCLSRK